MMVWGYVPYNVSKWKKNLFLYLSFFLACKINLLVYTQLLILCNLVLTAKEVESLGEPKNKTSINILKMCPHLLTFTWLHRMSFTIQFRCWMVERNRFAHTLWVICTCTMIEPLNHSTDWPWNDPISLIQVYLIVTGCDVFKPVNVFQAGKRCKYTYILPVMYLCISKVACLCVSPLECANLKN